jgi:hypothetical protein
MGKINLTESEFKILIHNTVKIVLSEHKNLNEEFKRQLYSNNDVEEILKNYLNDSISTLGTDPDTESEGGYGWDYKYNVNDFDEETITQARKDIKWFLFKADKLLRFFYSKYKNRVEPDEIAWGMVTSRNMGTSEFWNLESPFDDYFSDIAIQLGYITIIKTKNGKLRIVKKEI